MSAMRLIITVFLLGFSTLSASPPGHKDREQSSKFGGAIQIGNVAIGVDTKGDITVRTPHTEVVVPIDSTAIKPAGPTDLYIDPRLLQGPGQPVFGNEDRLSPFSPTYGPGAGAAEFLNHLGFFFSTASGGFGFRINYDRKVSPHLRVIASPEFLTYGLLKAANILGQDMPQGTTRITLLAMPIGLQRQFSPESRINPHIGFGLGPIVRLDHRSTRPGYYPYSRLGFDRSTGYGHNGLGFTIPLYLDDFPRTSLTLGGHLASGLNIRLGSSKDYALTLEGRYTLARFTDALGSPGDFSGFSLAIGFGKAF